MKPGRGIAAGGVTASGASRGAKLQAALGMLVLLLLVFAWISLGDVPQTTPSAPPALVETPPAAPVSQASDPSPAAAAPTPEPVASQPSAQPAPAAGDPAPAAVAVAEAIPASALAPAAAAAESASQAASADKSGVVPPAQCEPAPQEAERAPAKRFPPPPPATGYMVQVGVFGDSEKAEMLRRELARGGQPAYLQSRVLLGPFPDRKAAQKAEEKIRRERKLGGMILPPSKP